MIPVCKVIVPVVPEQLLTAEEQALLSQNGLNGQWLLEFILALWPILQEAESDTGSEGLEDYPDWLYEFVSTELYEHLMAAATDEQQQQRIEQTLCQTFDPLFLAILRVRDTLRPFIGRLDSPPASCRLETITYNPFTPEAIVLTLEYAPAYRQWRDEATAL